MISQKTVNAVLDWKAVVNDIDVSQDELTNLLQAEWQEWHDSNHRDLFEVADICFVAIQLKDLVSKSGENHHTSYIEASHLLREKNAYKHLEAVIASNWTKYMPINKYRLIDASEQAIKASIKYKDRYTQIVPRLSACGKYYFLIGLTKQGVRKVIKPSCFVSAEKFL